MTDGIESRMLRATLDRDLHADNPLGLVERLRLIAAWNTPGGPTPSVKPDKMATCNEAADRLIDMTLEAANLRSENADLRATLKQAREALDGIKRDHWTHWPMKDVQLVNAAISAIDKVQP